MLKAFVLDCAVGEQFQLGQEHGGHPVQGGGLFLLYGKKRGFGIEGFGGEEDGGAMRGGCHVTENAAEAVEEWWRTADDVCWCETHA